MVRTRARGQSTLEETISKKRKTSKVKKEDEVNEEQEVKTLKKRDDTDDHHDAISINRAPVLDLFATCAAQFEHPSLTWSTCLSIGSAISTICAISKGRAIGQINEKGEESEEAAAKKEEAREGAKAITVLKFELPIKDGLAYVGAQKKPANEGYLKSKFGDRYEEAKTVIQESLQSWKGHEEEFDKSGFRMYEKFRPSSGWGQKGGLELDKVRAIITRK